MTICAKDKKHMFGKIKDGEMRLNELGKMVKVEWERTPKKRSNISLDVFIVMPNHFHGIVIINRRGELNSPATKFDKKQKDGRMQYAPTNTNKFQSPSQTIGSIIRGFKSACTRQIREYLSDPKFSVWQRNYYEHVI